MRLFIPMLAAAALAVAGCADRPAAPSGGGAFERFPDIAGFDFVKQVATVPVRDDVLVVDSRPAKNLYDTAHIPGAINIPDTFFARSVDRLPTDKARLIVFYCNGLECPLSHKSAFKAREMGYTNVKVYDAGMPDWLKKGQMSGVSLAQVKAILDNPDGTVLIDSRPRNLYEVGTIPGAVSLPDTFFERMRDKLPAAKTTPLVFFCNGPKCDLSSKSADKARALGYTNVRVFVGGEPAWRMAYGTGAKAAAAPAAAAKSAELQTLANGQVVKESFLALLKADPQSVTIVDVRDAKEFANGHFPTAVNVPVSVMFEDISKVPAGKPVVFVCATGARSSEAYDIAKADKPELKAYYLNATVTYRPDGSYVVE